MERIELIKKIMEKKEFSQLPKKDVELVLEKFDKPRNADYQKMKLTRQFLRKIFSGFSSRKVLHKRDESVEWFLKKHKSAKERFDFYKEVYSKCFFGFPGRFTVFDFGAGINGMSYNFFKDIGKKVNYVGVEAVGQFVELMNYYFENNNLNGKAIHESLFNLEKIKKILGQGSEKKIVFMFKVIDSLEAMKRDYSKEFLLEVSPLVSRIVVSFATKSLGARKKFGANRNWIVKFVQERFKMVDDFELGGERYLVFENGC